MSGAAAHDIRVVRRQDRRQLASRLADAFDDDALSRWVYAEHPSRRRWLTADFRLRLAQHAPDALTFAPRDLAGAAVWAAPAAWRGHARGQARALLALPRVIRNHERIFAVQRELDAQHPVRPHLYLALLGVVASRRRSGLGSALIEPGLAVADGRRMPAYVESGSPDATAFYRAHAFEVVGEVALPGAPVITLMWREPR